jgi:hypothetical protein
MKIAKYLVLTALIAGTAVFATHAKAQNAGTNTGTMANNPTNSNDTAATPNATPNTTGTMTNNPGMTHSTNSTGTSAANGTATPTATSADGTDRHRHIRRNGADNTGSTGTSGSSANNSQ